jgi:hypothetical protein
VGLFEDPSIAFLLLNTTTRMLVDGVALYEGGDAATSARAALTFHRAMREAEAPHAKVERARWLDRIGSVAAFPSGVVAASAMPDDLTAVEMVVTPEEFVIVRPGPDGLPGEIGRIRRDAVRGLDVLDEQGSAVPKPANDSLEEDALCRVGLRWTDAAGKEQEDSFLFRAPSVAWETADRISRFAATAGA